jgi:hypothetical protein
MTLEEQIVENIFPSLVQRLAVSEGHGHLHVSPASQAAYASRRAQGTQE